MLLAKYYLETEADTDNFTILMNSDNQKCIIEYGFGKLDKEKNKYVDF